MDNGNVDKVAKLFGAEVTANMATAINGPRRFSQRLYNLYQIVGPELRDKVFSAYSYVVERENYPLRKYNYRL